MHQSTPTGKSVSQRGQSAGFTITEILVVVAILFVLLTGIMTTYVFSIWSFQSITNYVQLHQDGRTAVNQFLKDMRGVASVVTFANNGPFVARIITNYFNNAPLTTTVTYTFSSSGHSFSRADNSGTTLLAKNVNRATFSLYDKLGSNTVLTSMSKSVQLDLVMSNGIVSWPQTEDYLSARTVMRNTQ